MKKLIAVFAALLLFSCTSQKKYSDFDISYSRSGGFSPIYENLLIKGNSVHYSFEGQGKNIKKDLKITNKELQHINDVLSQNNFKKIREDIKKVYDNITTTINVKKGPNTAIKTDASFILENYQKDWDNCTAVFQDFIKSKNLNP